MDQAVLINAAKYIQNHLLKLLDLIAKTQWGQTNRGRILIEVIKNALLTPDKIIWEFEVPGFIYYRYTYRVVHPYRHKIYMPIFERINTPIAAPQGASYHKDKIYIRIDASVVKSLVVDPPSEDHYRLIRGEEGNEFVINTDIREILASLANESVHDYNKGKYDINTGSYWKPHLWPCRQEEADSDQAEREMRTALGLPQRVDMPRDGYPRNPSNPKYKPVGQ